MSRFVERTRSCLVIVKVLTETLIRIQRSADFANIHVIYLFFVGRNKKHQQYVQPVKGRYLWRFIEQSVILQLRSAYW